MSDIECPYCGEGQEINHDDGYGYSEDDIHQQDCSRCENAFAYTTSVSFTYYPTKAPCMNGEDHAFKPTHTYPKWHTKMRCEYCDIAREPTLQERITHEIPPVPEHYKTN